MTPEAFKALQPPEHPGVYLMRDQRGKIIYIGKAVDVKKRLASYFRPLATLDPKTQSLVQRIDRIEWILTDNEMEALILEANLIKQHVPRYNIVMRDDKSYPYLKLSVQDAFPALTSTRKPFVDAAQYFGPFTTGALSELAQSLSMSFGLVICKQPGLSKHTQRRPCLYYQMGLCDGACIGLVSPRRYRVRVQRLIRFLQGGPDRISPRLQKRMTRAAQEKNYELAANYRDQLRAIEKIRMQPTVSSPGREDRDVIGLARSGADTTAEIFFVRQGNILGRRQFHLQHAETAAEDILLRQMILQYYSQPVMVPPRILLRRTPDELLLLRAWLAQKSGREVAFEQPESKDDERLLQMAESNAWLFLKSHRPEADQSLTPAMAEALQALAELLGLEKLPRRIEGYDISNIAGQDAVGSQVVFIHGQPDKSLYRRYRIKTVKGANDFAMLKEVLTRRLRKWTKDSDSLGPDLLMIDGGAGQVSAARQALAELGHASVPIVGLAKKHEELYLPERSEPIRAPLEHPGLMILTRLRDEAHRFALRFHRTVRAKRFTLSDLDTIPGLGPVKRRELLRRFGSVEALLRVDELALAQEPHIGLELARQIQTALKRKR